MKRLTILLALLAGSVAASAQCGLPFTDTFPGTGALGGCWVSPTGVGGIAVSPIIQNSGQAIPTTSGSIGFAVLTGATVSPAQTTTFNVGVFFPPSQGGNTGPMVRADASGNGYTWDLMANQINVFTAGNYTATLTSSCPSTTVSDVISLAIDSSFNLTCTDVTSGLSAAATDGLSRFATGVCGAIIDQSVSTNAQMTDFSCTGVTILAAPTFSPSPGSYASVSVTLTPPSGATACYTTNGTTPTATTAGTCDQLTYTTPIVVSSTETIKALSTQVGQTNSSVVSGLYTITTPQTYYVGLDGGNITQCDGKTNHALAGATGTNCRVNHPYWLLNFSGAWANFTGGDTIQFNDAGPYYMGEELNGVGQDWQSVLGICPAPNGDGSSCILPPFPSGSAGHPTRMLGVNAGSCTNLSSRTQLLGINHAFGVIVLQGSAYPDVECLDISQPDQCTGATPSGRPGGFTCQTGVNNFATSGIILESGTAQGPSNSIIKDVAVHGISNSGVLGSHLGLLSSDVDIFTDILLDGNGMANWNSDGGGCGTSCESVGTQNFTQITGRWGGCAEVKPNGGTIGGNGHTYCADDSNGGYGDDIVFIAANSIMNFSDSTLSYSTQDCLDALHFSDDLTSHPVLNLWNNSAVGCMGQTYKMGGATIKGWNNYGSANCLRLSQTFSPNPSDYNAFLSDFCRASGNQIAVQMNDGQSFSWQYNTSVGYGATMYDLEAAGGGACTTHCTVIFQNNLSLGFVYTGYNADQLPGGFVYGIPDPFANSGSLLTHNLWFNMRTGPTGACPQDSTYETDFVCADPLLVSESSYDSVNPNLTGSSPAIGAGLTISGITTDFNGNPRPAAGQTNPSIGAFEPVGASSGTIFSGSVVISGGTTVQ